ncbi:MAG: hypothetical protein JSW63_04005 [Ignavibacterium sp.]|nr:MAG: hypothetical protein JSW63_04005 [Ignavibacterium sp.]
MKLNHFLLLSILLFTPVYNTLLAQEDEPIRYFQMEPLDDSLFIYIQQELYIDPPDPKAEIIADLRDPNNQTISIRGSLYPFLALSPEIRARVITYPFKINLEEDIHYASVFTRVLSKLKISKIVSPPTKQQISSTMWYINPFFQMLGGERFGLPIKRDIGISFGLQTRYEGPLNTNFMDANFHILGAYVGAFTNIDALINTFSEENQNNMIFSTGFQIGYVLPFGNFFELSYLKTVEEFSATDSLNYLDPSQGTVVLNSDSSVRYSAWLVEGSFFNYELRYPLKVLGSTKGRVYASWYLHELHFGFDFREMSLAGSTFDFWFDVMTSSRNRLSPLYTINLTVQKVAESWGFSAFSVGPSLLLGTKADGTFGLLKLFVNMRLKIGSSL